MKYIEVPLCFTLHKTVALPKTQLCWFLICFDKMYLTRPNNITQPIKQSFTKVSYPSGNGKLFSDLETRHIPLNWFGEKLYSHLMIEVSWRLHGFTHDDALLSSKYWMWMWVFVCLWWPWLTGDLKSLVMVKRIEWVETINELLPFSPSLTEMWLCKCFWCWG